VKQDVEKAVFTVDEACTYLSISRPKLDRLIYGGEILSLKVGRRRLLRRSDCDAYLKERVEAERLRWERLHEIE
jgi:excisionase family DNA binding protein